MELWPENPLGKHFMGPRPEGTPVVFWRRAMWMRVISSGLFMAMMIPASLSLFYFSHVGREPKYWGLIPGALFICAYTIFAIVPRFMQRRFRTRLDANEGLLCLHCGYSLLGLPDEHVCPECGGSYNADETRTAWSNWLLTGDMRKAK